MENVKVRYNAEGTAIAYIGTLGDVVDYLKGIG